MRVVEWLSCSYPNHKSSRSHPVSYAPQLNRTPAICPPASSGTLMAHTLRAHSRTSKRAN
jgi:hypothetical protein